MLELLEQLLINGPELDQISQELYNLMASIDFNFDNVFGTSYDGATPGTPDGGAPIQGDGQPTVNQGGSTNGGI